MADGGFGVSPSLMGPHIAAISPCLALEIPMISQEQIDALFAEFRKEASRVIGVPQDKINFMTPTTYPALFGGRGSIGMQGICWARRHGYGRFFYADTGEPIAM